MNGEIYLSGFVQTEVDYFVDRWSGCDPDLQEVTSSSLEARCLAYRPAFVIWVAGGDFGADLHRCSRLAEELSQSVLIADVLASPEREMQALAAGAVLYFPIDVNPKVVQARVDRMSGMFHTALHSQGQRIWMGDIEMNLGCRTVFLNSVEVKLTRQEFDLLALLMRHPERVLSSELLAQALWPMTGAGKHQLEVAVSRLRQKLALHLHVNMVLPVRGTGYRINRNYLSTSNKKAKSPAMRG